MEWSKSSIWQIFTIIRWKVEKRIKKRVNQIISKTRVEKRVEKIMIVCKIYKYYILCLREDNLDC
jgi:hypothetical protein